MILSTENKLLANCRAFKAKTIPMRLSTNRYWEIKLAMAVKSSMVYPSPKSEQSVLNPNENAICRRAVVVVSCLYSSMYGKHVSINSVAFICRSLGSRCPGPGKISALRNITDAVVSVLGAALEASTKAFKVGSTAAISLKSNLTILLFVTRLLLLVMLGMS